MSRNRIDGKLSQADMDFILNAFKEMRAKMPFAVTLNDADKESLSRLSDKNRMFMRKILDAVEQNPDLLPARFNVDELRNDIELHGQLFTLLQQAKLYVEFLEDNYRLSGTEGYVHCLQVYKYLQAANAVTGEMDAVLDELGKLFVRRTSQVVEPAKSGD